MKLKDQPSKETIVKMLNFFMKTSVPRLLAKKEEKKGV
jgi:hypothetical protein